MPGSSEIVPGAPADMLTPPARPCTVLIARRESLGALERQTRPASGELIMLTDAEPLQALEVISSRRPDVIALERVVAATPRGAALIDRLRADPALAHTEIRLVADGETIADGASAAHPDLPEPRPAASGLDPSGTRRAERFRIAGQRQVLVDGAHAVLVDLSTAGAQLISPTVLRPNQRVRVALADEESAIRCGAVVAWALFEIPPKTDPRYRAGLEFLNADPKAIGAFCLRHREP
jgi:hypothetical protein